MFLLITQLYPSSSYPSPSYPSPSYPPLAHRFSLVSFVFCVLVKPLTLEGGVSQGWYWLLFPVYWLPWVDDGDEISACWG